MLDNQGLFIVTDLKQYTFCPRLTYFENCLPDFRPRTYLMDAGREAHRSEGKRAIRRTMSAYRLPENCKRQFEVELRSEQLGIAGKVDEVIVMPGAPLTCYPVDYKMGDQVNDNHRLQIAAYALLLEDVWGARVPHGYIYLPTRRRAETVSFSTELRQALAMTLSSIQHIIRYEEMPSPPRSRSRCHTCEFRRACNDI